MAGCALNFEEGRTMIHQVLGVRPGALGASGMPATRRGWYQAPVPAPVSTPAASPAPAANGAVAERR
jgi:cyclopropane-fatty-acyl-phospholipid synthase